MADDFVIVPSKESDFVELSRLRSGRLFRKHLLNKGPLIYKKGSAPARVVNIDDEFVATLTKNFHDGVCDIVQAPVAGAKNEHTEDPFRNIGEVVDIKEENGKVYAYLDARDQEAADKLGKTLLGASAYMNLDYYDTKTGKPAGPTLLHMAITNRPYVTGLEDFEEIVAATADTNEEAVLLTEADVLDAPETTPEVTEAEVEIKPPDDSLQREILKSVEAVKSLLEAPPEVVEPEAVGEVEEVEETTMPTLEELLATLKEEHGIDVSELQSTAAKAKEEAESASALSTTLTNELTEAKAEYAQVNALVQSLSEAVEKSGIVKLSNGEDFTPEDMVGAVSELAQGHLELTNKVEVLERKDAENYVETLIAEGRIRPAKKKSWVDLRLSNPSMFDQLLPDAPEIKLNNEEGTEPPEEQNQEDFIARELERLEKGAAARYLKASK